MLEPEGFGEFVAARSAALVRIAWLLTGDEGQAQDLVQTALAKTWTRWSGIAEGRYTVFSTDCGTGPRHVVLTASRATRVQIDCPIP